MKQEKTWYAEKLTYFIFVLGSHQTTWPQTCCAVQASLEDAATFLPLPPELWGYKTCTKS